MPPRLTCAWENHKNNFLSRHSFNSRIESALKRIERKMGDVSFTRPKIIEYFVEDTHLSLVSAKRLICLCITNPQTCEFAPAYLFLAAEYAMQSPNDAVLALHMAKKELGW